MIHFIKTYFWLFLPLFLFRGTEYQLDSHNTIQYAISVQHPGEKGVVNVILNQNLDENGLPIQYFMDVESVICLAEVCKVIPVRIFWNNLGEYQRYKLEKGATLEKYEADIFESNDYKKLHCILGNSNSPFRDVFIDEIWTVPTTIKEDVDAISGATILELDEEDTVPGAALTCYTLWHWANGKIVQKIKEITGNVLSNNQLKRALTDKNRNYYSIGIKELENRKNYTNSFIKITIEQVLDNENLLKPTFKYLEKSPFKTYFEATKLIFKKGKKAQKLASIRSLRSTKYKVPNIYLDDLSDEISTLNSYQEVSFFLDLMQSKNANSKKVIENVFLLLNSDFLKARKAYWFLKNQKTTSFQEKKLKEFYQKNKNSL